MTQILRIKGINQQMDDFTDMMNLIDKRTQYLEPFKRIVTSLFDDNFKNNVDIQKYIMLLKKEFFSDEKFIVDVLKTEKKTTPNTWAIREQLDKYGTFFSKLILRGIISEYEENASSIKPYINDPKIISKLDDESVRRGQIKLSRILSNLK